MKSKNKLLVYISLSALLLFIGWNNSAKAIPMAPPMCEVEATVEKVNVLSKNEALGDIRIFSSVQSNDLADCSKLSGKFLSKVNLSLFKVTGRIDTNDLTPGAKIKGFLLLPDISSFLESLLSSQGNEYRLDDITFVDKFYGTGTINEKISLLSNVNILIAVFVFICLALISIYLFRKKKRIKK